MIVYKYLHPDRIDVVVNSSIRFTQPDELNDPFESMPNFSEYRKNLHETLLANRVKKFGPDAAHILLEEIERTIDDGIQDIPKILGEHFGILSLSKTAHNPLMWVHYADRHQGFVLGFDSTNSFFAPGNGKALEGLRPVIYASERVVMPRKGLLGISHQEKLNINEGQFFTKSIDWSYEQEMRILGDPRKADRIISKKSGSKIYLFNYLPDAIREIILGLHMPQAKREELIEMCRSKFHEAKVFTATLNPERFSIDIKPI